MHNVIQNCSVDVEQEAEPNRAYYITPQGLEVWEILRPDRGNYPAISSQLLIIRPAFPHTLTLSRRLLINVHDQFPTSLTFYLCSFPFFYIR